MAVSGREPRGENRRRFSPAIVATRSDTSLICASVPPLVFLTGVAAKGL